MERFGTILAGLMVVFLAFVGGALLVVSETPPHQFFRDAWMAAHALQEQRVALADPYTTDLWRDARRDDRGVTVHDPDLAQPGYTLYTSGDGPYAWLLTMEGDVAHEWRRPYSTVWEEGASAVSRPQPDNLIYMRKARVLPDGDLLAIYEAAGDSPYGYGMVRLDPDSEMRWRYLEHVHHDFDIAPDGRIVALTHEFIEHERPRLGFLERPHLDDFVVVLSPDGEELAKVSLIDALERSRYRSLLFAIPWFSRADPLHTNTVFYIDEQLASVFPVGEAGQVIVCFRDMGVIAVVDLELEEVVWATRGPWLGPHAPRVLDNGQVLLFDNLGAFDDENAARVVQFDPVTLETTWEYRGDQSAPLHSPLRSTMQRLVNGNTLITESDGGRLVEVTPDGRIAWEYVNPVRGGDDEEYIPVVSWGKRVGEEDLDRAFLASLLPVARRDDAAVLAAPDDSEAGH